MAQFGAILRLRRRLAKNRLTDLSPRRRTSMLLLFIAGAVTLVVGGQLAAPMLMEPPVDLATPRGLSPDDLPAGAAALEASFWLSALLASVLNFRVLELLFRRPDIVAMQVLPIEPSALFVDRLIATFIEAGVAAAAASLFFIPLAWHGGAPAAIASSAMLFGGLLFGATISLALMLLATQQLVPDDETNERAPSVTDAYGGTGQILLYAPALALGGVVVLALFWKLLLGEPLRLGYLSEPFWIGSAIIVAITISSLFMAHRVFARHYYEMAPRFHEADAADYGAFIDYQDSSYDKPRFWEFGLPASTARVVRALVLDDDRRVAGGRVGYAVVIVLTFIGLATIDLAAMPSWAAAIIPATLTAVIVNPWHRLSIRSGLLDDPLALPITEVDRRVAVDRISIREFLFIGFPYAVAAAAILGYFRGLGTEGYLIAACALTTGLGISAGISVFRHFGIASRALRWLPPVLLAALAGIAVSSLVTAIIVGLFTAVAAATLSRIARARTNHG